MHRSQLGVVTSKETRQSRTNTDREVARHSHSFSIKKRFMRGLGTLNPHRDRCVKASLRFEGDAVNSRRWRSKALVEVSRWAQAELYAFPMRVARRGAFTGPYCKNYGRKNSG